MIENAFSPENFFDLKQFEFKDIFTNKENVWEVVKEIAPYLDHLFSTKSIKGNIAENIFIHETARVDPTAKIIGPTIIGEGVIIGFNAYIRGNVIIDKSAVVGTGTEIKNSILLNTCKTSHFNYISDSILGNRVRFGAGAVISNKRLDRKNITIRLDQNKRIDTGTTRFGAIAGDDIRIGSNAVLNPGTVLGKGSIIFPLKSVVGVYEKETIIK